MFQDSSKSSGRFVEDFCNWQNNPYYGKFIYQSGLGKIAAKLTGSKKIRLYHDHMLTKEPGTRMATPWASFKRPNILKTSTLKSFEIFRY